MELYKYQIKDGETIVLIAEKLGISVSSLKQFHNSHTKPHEWIQDDDTLPSWTTHLTLFASEKKLKEDKHRKNSATIVNLQQHEIAQINYKIVQKIDMQISGNSMVDSETEIVWSFSKEKREDKFYAIVSQKSHQIKYIKSIYRNFAEYMQKFNIPLEHLILELETGGKIQNITNQQDILNSWIALRNSLSAEMGNTLDEKNMLEGGDEDFSDTLPLLKNNLLYKLFFNGAYQQYDSLDKFIEQNNEHYNSQIFSNEKVNIITKRKVEKSGNIAKIKYYSTVIAGENEHLRDIYNSKLREFLKEEFDYLFTSSTEYHFDIEKAQMVLCKSNIKEQAGNNYTHLISYEIELI